MTFATPWLLLLVPVAALVLAWRWLRPGPRASLAVADLGLLAAAAGRHRGWRVRLRWLPAVLRAVAVLLLVLAIARPQRGLAVTFVPEEGIDIVLAFDVSGSMTERVAGTAASRPTRLEAARTVIKDFVDSLEGDRVGLVVFQSRALALSPLTLDHEALKSAVEDADTGLLADGTAIGLGLAEALNVIRESEARSKVVVLLTDGSNNSGEIEPLQAAQLAKALDIRVYTIGFVSRRGADDIDEETLRRIAAETEAEYYDAATQADLERSYEAISKLERSRVGENRFTRYQEFGPWLAGAALALLTVEALSRATLFRRYP